MIFPGIETMGQNHTCHVVNDSKETVKIVVTDYENKNSTMVLAPGNVHAFPMEKWQGGNYGKITASLFRMVDGKWSEKAVACYTGTTDTSFIIDHGPEGTLALWQAVYGTLHDKQERTETPLGPRAKTLNGPPL